MSDELLLSGKSYVSSRRAAEQTGYARDYIGQLARGGHIDAERVGGLWYVSLESLEDYEKNAETARSFSSVSNTSKEAESSLSFEGKEYISASRASKVTGYNQDYIGQLARSSKIPSRQIGNRWYVDRDALVQHKNEKDALLAAVQSESVGLGSFNPVQKVTVERKPEHILVLPPLRYTQESADLMPRIPEKTASHTYPMSNFDELRPRMVSDATRAVQNTIENSAERSQTSPRPVKRSRTRLVRTSVGVSTIILVLSVGFMGLKGSQTFASIRQSSELQGMSAAAAEAFGGMGDVVENWVSPLIVYERGE